MPGARWFEGATLNYAEAVFARAAADRPALLAASERRPVREISWDELRSSVAAAAEGLRRLGVGRGDRVAAIVPNIPEAVIGLLATREPRRHLVELRARVRRRKASSTDFVQIEPKVLIAVDGYVHGGRSFDRRPVVEEIRAALPHLRAHGADPGARPGGRASPATRLDRLGTTRVAGPLDRSRSSPSRSTTRCGSSSRPAPPGCRRRSSTATAASSSSTLKAVGLHLDVAHRRPAPLVHDDRLDDVELPRRRRCWSAATAVLYDGSPATRISTCSGRLRRDDRHDPISGRAPRT